MAMLRYLPLLIVFCLLAYFLYKGVFLPMLSKAEEKEAVRKVAFEEAQRIAKHVKKSWMDYELNGASVYDYPSMIDVRVPEVAAFNREIVAFNDKYPDFEALTETDRLASEFILDSKRLGEKFEFAERRARMIDGGDK